MELSEMIRLQKEFSARHGWMWDVMAEKEVMERLNYGTIALIGECGEFANVVKKIMRDPVLFDEKAPHLREELTDILIYLMLLSVTLKTDIEKEWAMKMEKNVERFKKFEKAR